MRQNVARRIVRNGQSISQQAMVRRDRWPCHTHGIQFAPLVNSRSYGTMHREDGTPGHAHSRANDHCIGSSGERRSTADHVSHGRAILPRSAPAVLEGERLTEIDRNSPNCRQTGLVLPTQVPGKNAFYFETRTRPFEASGYVESARRVVSEFVTVHGGLSPSAGKGAGPCFRLSFFS